MVRTPELRTRLTQCLLAFAIAAVFGSACSATPNLISIESAVSFDAQPAGAIGDGTVPFTGTDQPAAADEPPAALAFVDQSSESFCDASANVWIHSAALNMVAAESNIELNQIALANVAEWLERATLFEEDTASERGAMFATFTELQTTVAVGYSDDWQEFRSSTAYENDPSAQAFEAHQDELVSFIDERCSQLTMSELQSDAAARSIELTAQFGTGPSTVVQSDSLPGHSIFSHSSGRLIASFPTAWAYADDRADASIELIASPDIDRFLGGEAIDGVFLQLVEADSIEAFRGLIDETRTSQSCVRGVDLSDRGTSRINITQTFECVDHAASIIGQYSEERGIGLIIEASFDAVDASRADLTRLASIANSALWS